MILINSPLAELNELYHPVYVYNKTYDYFETILPLDNESFFGMTYGYESCSSVISRAKILDSDET